MLKSASRLPRGGAYSPPLARGAVAIRRPAKGSLPEDQPVDVGRRVALGESDRHDGPDHERTFFATVEIEGEVRAEGSGASKKLARRAAAEAALAELSERYADVAERPLPPAKPPVTALRKRTGRAATSKRARA